MGCCNCGQAMCSENTGPKEVIHIPTSLRAGSVVVLTSGGCPMTVSQVKPDMVHLVWFAGPNGNELSACTLPLACVIPIEEA